MRRRDLEHVLADNGLDISDSRLAESLKLLKVHEAVSAAEYEAAPEPLIAERDFYQAIRPNIQLIERVLQGKLVIPDFADFSADLRHLYNETRENRGGAGGFLHSAVESV